MQAIALAALVVNFYPARGDAKNGACPSGSVVDAIVAFQPSAVCQFEPRIYIWPLGETLRDAVAVWVRAVEYFACK